MIDFDTWRREYDRLTYAEHVEFYRKVADVYPAQQQFNELAVRDFLALVRGDLLELGGWKGELAALMLPDFPLITSWLNIEIAPQAVTESTCTDSRYGVLVPDSFIWDSGLDLKPYRTLLASHVIEHVKLRDVVKLMGRLKGVDRLYVDAPLSDDPMAWDSIESSHILEVGWDGLANVLKDHGFRQVGRMDGEWGIARWFER